MAPTPALIRAENGRVGVTTPYNEQSALLDYEGGSLDNGSRGNVARPFTPYFQDGERLQFSPRSSDRNQASVGGHTTSSLYDPEEERSRLERENFDLKLQVYTLEQKVNNLESELEGDNMSNSDDEGTDWAAINASEQYRRSQKNEVAKSIRSSHEQENLNLMQKLEEQTVLLEENEKMLISRDTVLEQACAAIEQLQAQCSTLQDEKQEADDKLLRFHELEKIQTDNIQSANKSVIENLRLKSELESKTRECQQLLSLRDQFEEQNLLLEEANVALAELQERLEAVEGNKSDLGFKIQVLNSKKSEKSEVDLLEKIELEQSRNRELSRQLNLAQRDAEFYRAEADKSITLIQQSHAALASYQSPIKFDENEISLVSQIEDLTHHLELVKSDTESYQKKIEGCDTELLKAQNYIVELKKQLKENDRESDSRAQRQIEDLERQLEAARAELRFIEKESEERLILLEDAQSTVTELRQQIEIKNCDTGDIVKRQNEGLSQLLEAAERDALAYLSELEDHKRMLKQSQEEVQQLEEKLLSKRIEDDEFKQQQIIDLSYQLETASREAEGYKREIELKDSSLGQMQSAMSELRNLLETRDREFATQIAEKTKELSIQLLMEQNEKADYLKEIENCRKVMEEAKSTTKDLQQQLDQKERESDVLLRQRAQTSAQLFQFQEREKAHQLEVKEHEKLLTDAVAKAQETQQLEQKLRETTMQFQQQIQNSSQQLLSAQRDIKIYQVEVEERDRLLEEASTAIQELHRQLDQKEHEADELLRHQIHEQSQHLSSAQQEIDFLKREIDARNRLLDDAAAAANDLQKKFTQKAFESNLESQQLIEQLSNQLQSAKRDIEAYQVIIDTRNSLLQDSARTIQGMQQKIDEKDREESTLLDRIEHLSHQLQSAESYNSECQIEIDKRGAELEIAAARIQDLEGQVQMMGIPEATSQQQETKEKSSILLRQEIQTLSQELLSAEHNIRSQCAEIDERNRILEDSKVMVQELQQQLRKSDKLVADFNKLSLELESERKKGRSYWDAVEERNKVLEEARATIYELRARLEVMHKDADSVRGQQNLALSSRLEAVRDEADSARAQNLALWEQLGTMEKEVQKYRSEIEDRDDKLLVAQSAIVELERKLAHADQERESLLWKQYADLSRQLEAVQKDVCAYRLEIDSCNEELSDAHATITILMNRLKDNDLHSEEVINMRTEDFAQQFRSAHQVSEICRAETVELRSRLVDAQTVIDELRRELACASEHKMQTFYNSDDERIRILEEARNTVQELKSQLEKVHADASADKAHNNTLLEQLAAAENEAQCNRLQIADFNEKLVATDFTINELQTLVEQKEAFIAFSQSQSELLTQQLETMQKDMENYMLNIKKLNDELSTLSIANEELKHQLQQKDSEIDLSREKNELLSQKLIASQRDAASFQASLEESNERLARYQATLEDAKKKIDEQNRLCEDLSCKLDMQASKVNEYQSGAAEYQEALNSARALIDDLTQQLREKENQQKNIRIGYGKKGRDVKCRKKLSYFVA